MAKRKKQKIVPPETWEISQKYKYHYVYKISFPEVSKVYYGVRSCNIPPEEDTSYLGSPKRCKVCWKNYKPVKTILKIFDNRLDAELAESFLINWQWTSSPENFSQSLNHGVIKMHTIEYKLRKNYRKKKDLITKDQIYHRFYQTSRDGRTLDK